MESGPRISAALYIPSASAIRSTHHIIKLIQEVKHSQLSLHAAIITCNKTKQNYKLEDLNEVLSK